MDYSLLMKRKFPHLILVIIVLVGASTSKLLANESQLSDYTINVSESYAFKQGQSVASEILENIYSPLNITPTLHFMPTKRGLLMANKGEFDAEAARRQRVMVQYENLIKVPEPVIRSQFNYYCVRKELCSPHEDLIYIAMKGTEIVRLHCEQHNLKCLYINNDLSAFKALEVGSGDVLLTDELSAKGVICNSHIRHLYFKQEPTLDADAYHFIHRKNVRLVDQLNESIKRFKQSKHYQSIIDNLRSSWQKCGAKFTSL